MSSSVLFQTMLHVHKTTSLPPFLLNSRAFPLESQVILGTALSVWNQVNMSGIMAAKSSWKPSRFVSLTPIVTLSRPHSARFIPCKDNNITNTSHFFCLVRLIFIPVSKYMFLCIMVFTQQSRSFQSCQDIVTSSLELTSTMGSSCVLMKKLATSLPNGY